MQNTCIIIPCFNEGERLAVKTFSEFLEKEPCSIYFVNDGSKDHTLKILERIKISSPRQVEIVNLSINSGKGEAVRQGILAAIFSGKFDHVGYLDADLATPLEEIEYLLQYLKNEINIVLGARILRLGATIERDALRHYGGRVFATLASTVLDIKVYDSQCGAKFFKVKTAQLLFKDPFISKWLFDLEVLYRLKLFNPSQFDTITLEVPLRTWKEKGNSKIKMLDIFTAPFELIKIKQKGKQIKISA